MKERLESRKLLSSFKRVRDNSDILTRLELAPRSLKHSDTVEAAWLQWVRRCPENRTFMYVARISSNSDLGE